MKFSDSNDSNQQIHALVHETNCSYNIISLIHIIYIHLYIYYIYYDFDNRSCINYQRPIMFVTKYIGLYCYIHYDLIFYYYPTPVLSPKENYSNSTLNESLLQKKRKLYFLTRTQ